MYKASTPGVGVMITILCDFSQFSAKKLAFFLNTNVMINFFSKFSFVLSQKRHFFCKIFRQKYFKNHNIGPRSGSDELINGKLKDPGFAPQTSPGNTLNSDGSLSSVNIFFFDDL
jgi:hypothetical protein